MHLYFWSCLLVFWVPAVALLVGLWGRLNGPDRRAFWWACGFMAIVSFVMEYVYLAADIWNFSEAQDPLLGIRLFGAPIEEFVYWFGATPFVLAVYLLLTRRHPRRATTR